MTYRDEETCRLSLRGIWRRISAVLYELKMLTGLPIYELINRAVLATSRRFKLSASSGR